NDTLSIVGTNADEAVAISQSSTDPNTLTLDIGNDGTVDQSFDRTTFSHIDVLLKGGNDTFFEPAGVLADEQLTVNGGPGNDTITTGDGADTVIGSKGDDKIRTGNGDDRIFSGSGNDDVDGEKGNDFANLGVGDDTFTWLPGEGSDTVDGSFGFDHLNFVGAAGAEKMALTPNGRDAVFTRDVGTIRMDLHDMEALDLHALGNTDDITVGDMRGTTMKEANLDLAGPAGGGDGAADTITVDGTARADNVNVTANNGAVDVTGLRVQTHITSPEVADHLQVNTNDGNDRVQVDPAVNALIGVNVDLGAGQPAP